jgi:Mrp family chromosome partitioning ATPase
VAAAGQTTRGDLRRAVEKLAQVNATVIGTVLNQVTRQNSYGYGSGYGYSYGYKPYVTERAHANGAQHPNGKQAVPDASIQ